MKNKQEAEISAPRLPVSRKCAERCAVQHSAGTDTGSNFLNRSRVTVWECVSGADFFCLLQLVASCCIASVGMSKSGSTATSHHAIIPEHSANCNIKIQLVPAGEQECARPASRNVL